MKQFILSAGIALSLLAAPAVANTSGTVDAEDVQTLSDAQLG